MCDVQTLHNSSLARTKTCFMIVYRIERGPATKANSLQIFNKIMFTSNENKFKRGHQQTIAGFVPTTFQDPANRLIGKLPSVRKPAFWPKRDARSVNNSLISLLAYWQIGRLAYLYSLI